jgi:hypothetical protein
MAFNVTTFRSEMIGDGARPNLFEVELQISPTLSTYGGTTKLSDKFRFMCKSAQIPGSTLGVVNVPYFGREVKFVGNRTFADWTVTVINDEDFAIRKFFESWMNGINSNSGNERETILAKPSDYVCDALVHQYKKTGAVKAASYQFVQMFPTDLSAIDLDWGSNDTIEEFTVNFTYQYWKSIATPGASSALTNG